LEKSDGRVARWMGREGGDELGIKVLFKFLVADRERKRKR